MSDFLSKYIEQQQEVKYRQRLKESYLISKAAHAANLLNHSEAHSINCNYPNYSDHDLHGYVPYLVHLRTAAPHDYMDVDTECSDKVNLQEEKKYRETEDMQAINRRLFNELHEVFKKKAERATGANNWKRSHYRTSTSSLAWNRNKDEIIALQEELENQRIGRKPFGTEAYIEESILNIVFDSIFSELIGNEIINCAEEIHNELSAQPSKRVFELSDEDEALVEDVIFGDDESEIIITKFNVDMTRELLLCMQPGIWLNDEVINFWFQLLAERDVLLAERDPTHVKSLFQNTFFFAKLSENGYNYVNVRRWTRKVDIFALNKVLIPVNVSNTHWCLAVIFMKQKKIQYYDSMNGSGKKCLQLLLRYLKDEMSHKKQLEFDDSDWELVPTELDTPQQRNGCDCGVFTCTFADYISLDEQMAFGQNEMPFFRKRMVASIANGTIV